MKPVEPSPLVLHVRGVTGCGGGPEKTILNSPRFLSELGYRSHCAYMHPPDDPGFAQLRRRAERAEAPLVPIVDRGPLDTQVVRQLIDHCRSERVAIWHGHDYKSNALGLLVRRFVPLRLVTTVHGWGVQGGRTRLYYRLDKLCLRYYEQVYCVSDSLHEECLQLGVPPQRCLLVPNAIDTEQYRRRRTVTEARRVLSEEPRGLLLGALGRLSPEKGFDLLIEAAAGLIGAGCDLSLWIGGEGPQREHLQRMIEVSGQADRIRLLGHVDHPIDFFEALDLFVLASTREGLPNVVLEAMALEVPLIATRVAGVPKLITDREHGLLVDCGSTRALEAGIETMIEDVALRRDCAAAARRLVETTYGFRRRMEVIAGHYDRLLGRSPAGESVPPEVPG